MWKSRLLYVLKKLLVISAYVAIAGVMFVGLFLYVVLAAIGDSSSEDDSAWGYGYYSFRNWGLGRRWGRRWW